MRCIFSVTAWSSTPGSALRESAAEKHFGKQGAITAIIVIPCVSCKPAQSSLYPRKQQLNVYAVQPIQLLAGRRQQNKPATIRNNISFLFGYCIPSKNDAARAPLLKIAATNGLQQPFLKFLTGIRITGDSRQMFPKFCIVNFDYKSKDKCTHVSKSV